MRRCIRTLRLAGDRSDAAVTASMLRQIWVMGPYPPFGEIVTSFEANS